jgi:hypothetical protein
MSYARNALAALAAATVIIQFGCHTTQMPDVEQIAILQFVDPLEKVLREAAYFPNRPAVAEVARGEHATLQFVFRCDQPIQGLRAEVGPVALNEHRLPEAEPGYVGYVRVGRSTPSPSRDRIPSPSGYYPDPILDVPPAELRSHTAQPIWITIPIPEDANPGTYRGTITVTGRTADRDVELSHDFRVVVFPVTITETRLWVTNWFSTAPDVLARMNGGEPVEPFSAPYWESLRVIARKMADYRQNVALLSPLRMTTYDYSDGRYTFDFENFDRAVQMFIDEGVVGRIEGGHIGTRESTWTTPFQVFVPIVQNTETTFEKFSPSSDEASGFYREFVPALMQHLGAKGWRDIYMQHLADEPITENVDSYIEIANLVRQHAPDVDIVEACHSRDLDNTVNVWVPQLNFLDEDFEFYQTRAEAGAEVWFYTCLNPQGEYANRFVELPLIKTRLLHWINFRAGSPGYLHWGFNFWRGDPFDEVTGIITESGNVLPGGDAWIVYPGNGKLLSSIRLEAMRDGIVDYELLKMLETRDPALAAELARQVVYTFDRYDMDVPSFREKRREILRALGG